MNRAYIGMGSNLEPKPGADAAENLQRARMELEGLQALGVRVVAASAVYRTEPQGYSDQPWFANQVLALDCPDDMTPKDLLNTLLALELRMGRVRSDDPALRFGPRVIDLDILLFGKTTTHSPRLTLPHPRMTERAFVLVPLLEIAPDVALPSGERLAGFLHSLDYAQQGFTLRQPAKH